MSLVEFLHRYGGEMLLRTSEHLRLSLVAVLGAVILGVPVGILVARRPVWQRPVLGLANIFQTVPSLALFGFLMPLLGLGDTNAVCALILYSLLPIVRNTTTGIEGVDPSVREAAQAMGMTHRQVLRQVELPLASAVILAGVRTATVVCIGVTTIASFIGAGGLGELIQNGLRANDTAVTLAGAAPAALLALLADGLLGYWQSALAARSAGGTRGVASGKKIAPVLTSAAGLALLALLLLGFKGGERGAAPAGAPRLRVVSKEFTESRILAAILVEGAQRHGMDAELGPELGGNLCHQALLGGKADIYPEYTGTAYMDLLKNKPQSDARRVYDAVKQQYAARFDLRISPPLGFSNGFAMLIRGADAKKLGLATLADAVPAARDWTAGFGPDFINRADGWPGLAARYGLQLKGAPRSLDLGLLNRALATGQVDLIAGNETDGTIASLNLYQLRDNLGYFPPYEGIFVVRSQILRDQPALGALLEELHGALPTTTMRQLNYEVDGEHATPKEAAHRWWLSRK